MGGLFLLTEVARTDRGASRRRRVGIANGGFEVPNTVEHNDEIVKLFTGGTQS
jgi:hypothetical protein